MRFRMCQLEEGCDVLAALLPPQTHRNPEPVLASWSYEGEALELNGLERIARHLDLISEVLVVTVFARSKNHSARQHLIAAWIVPIVAQQTLEIADTRTLACVRIGRS